MAFVEQQRALARQARNGLATVDDYLGQAAGWTMGLGQAQASRAVFDNIAGHFSEMTYEQACDALGLNRTVKTL